MAHDNSLLKCVTYGRGARVRRLVKDGLVDVNLEDENGKPAIFKAVENGYLDIAKTLLQNKANVNAKFNGRSLINIAIGTNNTKFVGLLLAHGVDLEDKCFGVSPYDYAMQLKNYEIAKMIFDHVLSENQKTKLQDCIICFNPRTEVLAFDCNHAQCCETCCLKIMEEINPKCPYCRSEVTQYSRIFV